MRGFVHLIAAAALAASGAPAFAQLTQAEEEAELNQLDCVYNGISDEAVDALALAYADADNRIADNIVGNLSAAVETCTTSHGWDEHRSTMAYEAAVAGSVVDVFMYDLEDSGMANPDNLITLWNELPDEDMGVLLADGARASPEFVAKVRPKLLAAGVPNNDVAVNKALTIFEAATYGSYLSAEWLAAADARKKSGAP